MNAFSTAIREQLRALADPAIAAHSRKFFKTGPGDYAEGDQCLGIRVPALRGIARQHQHEPLQVAYELLDSPYHEERFLALVMMVNRFKKAGEEERKAIFDYYLSHTQQVNNWDLVDCSAHLIVGDYLLHRSRRPLYRLAQSSLLWDRRISMIATYAFIKEDDFSDTLKLAETHLSDSHDLMHKAVGWMLRELGKRNPELETDFLDKHYRTMPRTMLRYAIEKYPEEERQTYLKGLR